MDINRLQEFIVLSDCLNYSKAANMLYLTQPVLSRHIHDLEDTFGAQLFVRDTHKVELTEIGRIAARELSAVVDAYNHALKNIHQASDFTNSNIKVGLLGQAVKPFISHFTHTFEAQHPSIHVDYTSSHLDELITAVDDDELDLAFISHINASQFKGFEIRHIADDKLCVVVPVEHPFCNRDSISVMDLSGEPMINFSRESNPHTAIYHEKLFQKFGARLHVIRTVNNVDSGLFYTAMGAGLFIIPRHLTSLAGDMCVVPIRDEEAVISLHLIWKKANTKSALQTFVRDFTAFYQEEEQM